ncbi:MAG: JAB domain-containing protein [Paludibacter sp.]|nr:JAB domain-containing protein [Paludibacter sp.]
MKVTEIKISYVNTNPTKTKIVSSNDVYSLILDHWDSNSIELLEEVKIILLNNANVVLGVHELSKGGITQCTIDFKIILCIALKCLATAIIIVHNHPSGTLHPSDNDISVTTKLRKACELVEVKLLDHLIISNHGYISLADNGNM